MLIDNATEQTTAATDVLVAIIAAAFAVVLALVHQVTAKKARPAMRGLMEMSLLLLWLAIFAAAVHLAG